MNSLAIACILGLSPQPDLNVVWDREITARTIEAHGSFVLAKTDNLVYVLLDANTGATIGFLSNTPSARFSGSKILLVRGNGELPEAIEAWSPSPLEREWTMPVSGRVGLGELVGNNLYYGTETSVVKVSLPEFQVLDRRDFPQYHSPLAPRVSGNRVYFARMHEVYGLDANNLNVGWRNYCDCWPQFMDSNGFVGTGKINYPLAIVRSDGRTVPYEKKIEGQYTFWREAPAVTGDTVIASGNVSVFSGGSTSHQVTVLSQYLFAFDRQSGKQLWKLAMSASNPLVVGSELFHIGGNRVGDILVETYQLRNIRTGKLIWKSKPIPGGFEGEITTNGQLLFERTGGRIRAIRLAK